MNNDSKIAANERLHLLPPELTLLLADNYESEHCRDAAEHLENCTQCQSRLTAMAADESWWSDAQNFLSGDAEPRWQPDTSCAEMATGDAPRDSEAIDQSVRELLETPRHPEMFGRLGRYDIERVIGHGGMGIVLKAHDSELNRPIAIKLLAGHLAHVGAARERFAREGRAAAAVVHEHVVAIYNVESNDKVPFLVMQYVPGRSLQARVDQDGPLATDEILRIGMQSAAGLAAAHRQGLVHRDVKPSNILLEDTVERAVLTDFGLARTFDDASLTHTGILAGTPHYMSPEQAMGELIDPRSDLFSLGAVLYFMATGRPPFRAGGAMAVLHRICRDTHRPVWQRNHEIPDALSDVIDRLLAKNPNKRFSSAEEVQPELATLLSRSQQHGLGRRRFRGWRVRRPTTLAAVGALGIAAIAALGITIGALREPIREGEAPAEPKAPVRTAQQELRPPATVFQNHAATQAESNLATDERQLLGDFATAESALNRSSYESIYLQQGDDPWRRELEALQRDVEEFESNNNSISQ